MNKTNKLSCDEHKKACDAVFAYVRHLERVQQLPMATRLVYFQLAYKAYRILLKAKLLGRREGGFDPLAYEDIRRMLSENLVDNGTGED